MIRRASVEVVVAERVPSNLKCRTFQVFTTVRNVSTDSGTDAVYGKFGLAHSTLVKDREDSTYTTKLWLL